MKKTGVVCILICSICLLFFISPNQSTAYAANTIKIANFYGEIKAYDEFGQEVEHSYFQQSPINFEDSTIFTNITKIILYPQPGKTYEYSTQEDGVNFVLIKDGVVQIDNIEYLTVREVLYYDVCFCYEQADQTFKIKKGSLATPPPAPTKDKHDFLGWQEIAKEGVFDFSSTAINRNYTFYPVFLPHAQEPLTQHIITFDLFGGTQLCDTPTTQTIDYGGTAAPPQVQPPAGHIFVGWDGQYCNITADTTIKAIYTKKQFGVTFDLCGGTQLCDTPTAQTIDYGGTAAPPQVQPPTGYSFVGWDNQYSNITADTTIKAKYQLIICKIGFYVENELFLEVSLDFGTPLIPPSQSTLAPALPQGKQLDGWTQDGTTPYSFGIANVAELKLFAMLKTKNHKVYFELGEGSTQSDIRYIEQTVLHGQAATPPIPQPPFGYHFVGWDSSWQSITADVTIHAIYEIIRCQVSFYINGENKYGCDILYGTAISPPTADTLEVKLPEGCYISGWTADRTSLYDFSVGITSTTRFDAVLEKYKYKINFYDGETLLTGDAYTLEIEHGSAIAALPQAPHKEKAEFLCWMATPTSDRPFNSQESIKNELNLYAKYSILSYTVYVQATNGIDIKLSSQYAQQGQEITFSYTLPEGYTLESSILCYEQTQQTLTENSFAMPACDVTLVLTLSSQKYNIYIKMGDSTTFVTYGETYMPAQPTPPAHYVFEGWYTDSSLNTAYSGVCKADCGDTIYLYPKFEKAKYTITFVYDYGGITSQTQNVQYGDYPVPPTLSQTDYIVFVGWDAPLARADSDTTYTAIYKLLFEVSYYFQDTLLHKAQGELGKPPADVAPHKEGYEFLGFVLEQVDTTTHTAIYQALYTKQAPAITQPPAEQQLPPTQQQAPETPILDTLNPVFSLNKIELFAMLMCCFVAVKLLSSYISKRRSSILP